VLTIHNGLVVAIIGFVRSPRPCTCQICRYSAIEPPDLPAALLAAQWMKDRPQVGVTRQHPVGVPLLPAVPVHPSPTFVAVMYGE
jgi:hypothetical protein